MSNKNENSRERSKMIIYSNLTDVMTTRSRQVNFHDPSSKALVLLNEEDDPTYYRHDSSYFATAEDIILRNLAAAKD